MDVVVSAVLHSNVPVNPVAVRVEVPSQWLTTLTPGAGGFVLGAAVPDPGRLVHPSTVWITV